MCNRATAMSGKPGKNVCGNGAVGVRGGVNRGWAWAGKVGNGTRNNVAAVPRVQQCSSAAGGMCVRRVLEQGRRITHRRGNGTQSGKRATRREIHLANSTGTKWSTATTNRVQPLSTYVTTPRHYRSVWYAVKHCYRMKINAPTPLRRSLPVRRLSPTATSARDECSNTLLKEDGMEVTSGI